MWGFRIGISGSAFGPPTVIVMHGSPDSEKHIGHLFHCDQSIPDGSSASARSPTGHGDCTPRYFAERPRPFGRARLLTARPGAAEGSAAAPETAQAPP